MNVIKVGGYVEKQLEPGEQVLGAVTGATYQESMAGHVFWKWNTTSYYATNKRLLRYEKLGWWVFFFGIFGFLKKKDFTGAVDYSGILGTEMVSYRPLAQVIAGIILGLVLVGTGFLVAITSWGQVFSFIGWFFIALGAICAAVLCGVKQAYCQLKVTNLTQNELFKWRIYLPLLGTQRNKIRKFAKLVDGLTISKGNEAVPFQAAVPAPIARLVEIPIAAAPVKMVAAPAVGTFEPVTSERKPPRARLVLPDNHEIPFTEKPITLGRDDFESHISSEILKFISRQHLAIGWEATICYAADCGSSNGTRINGTPVKTNEKYRLNDGDLIVLGEVLTLVFRINDKKEV